MTVFGARARVRRAEAEAWRDVLAQEAAGAALILALSGLVALLGRWPWP